MLLSRKMWYTLYAMRYLFFDIECADGFHICSLGYVLVDETFAVLDKQDLLMNPKCAFRLRRGGKTYIQLAYEESEFRRHPHFGRQYERIKALLTAPDTVLLGHSISSDLNFLETAYDAFGVPHLSLAVYDTQSMYAKADEAHQTRSLEGIVADLGIDVTHLTEHKSCDDAEMSMLVAKELCRRADAGIEELLRRNADCVVRSTEIVVAKALKKLKQAYQPDRRAPAVCFSDDLPCLSPERRIRFLRALLYHGYTITSTVSKSRFFVTMPHCHGARDATYAAKTAEGKKIRALTPMELGDMLHIQADENAETDALVPDPPARKDPAPLPTSDDKKPRARRRRRRRRKKPNAPPPS